MSYAANQMNNPMFAGSSGMSNPLYSTGGSAYTQSMSAISDNAEKAPAGPDTDPSTGDTGSQGGGADTGLTTAGKIGAVTQGLGAIYAAGSDINRIAQSDPGQMVPDPATRGDQHPGQFMAPENPYEDGVGGKAVFEYGTTLASTGATLGGPVGAAVGGAVGVGLGLYKGSKNAQKQAEFESEVQDARQRHREEVQDYWQGQREEDVQQAQNLYNQKRGQAVPPVPSSIYQL